MTRCPECQADLELDGYELDVDETINCPECSTELRVTNSDPIAVALADTEDQVRRSIPVNSSGNTSGNSHTTGTSSTHWFWFSNYLEEPVNSRKHKG